MKPLSRFKGPYDLAKAPPLHVGPRPADPRERALRRLASAPYDEYGSPHPDLAVLQGALELLEELRGVRRKS